MFSLQENTRAFCGVDWCSVVGTSTKAPRRFAQTKIQCYFLTGISFSVLSQLHVVNGDLSCSSCPPLKSHFLSKTRTRVHAKSELKTGGGGAILFVLCVSFLRWKAVLFIPEHGVLCFSVTQKRRTLICSAFFCEFYSFLSNVEKHSAQCWSAGKEQSLGLTTVTSGQASFSATRGRE